MRRLRFCQLLILLSLSLTALAGESADSLTAPQKRSKTEWIGQLIRTGFQINDSTINYPAFPRFCVKVYNWGDRTFNSYDHDYVVNTGHNWKLRARSFNWMENYAFMFPDRREVFMRSNLYADIGASLNFMAVSVGYMFNANDLVHSSNDTRNIFTFNFTCSRFTIDLIRTYTRGGAKITHISDYKTDHWRDIPFDNITNTTTALSGTYFFGHNRYSHAAAYSFSKFQLKSAGSWLAGIIYLRQNLFLDLSSLPQELIYNIPVEDLQFRFHYTDYMLAGGYGYNWAIRPRKWLLNITGKLGMGYKHTYEDNTDGRRSMIALNPVVDGALVYNHRSLFAALQGHFSGRFYFNGNYTFFNSLSQAELTVGVRF